MNQKKLNWHNNDTILGIIILIFGIFYGLATLQIPGTKSQLFDSRFVPVLLTVFILLIGILELGRGLQKPIEENKAKKEFDTKTVIFTFALIILYILLYSILGFIVSTFLFLLLEMNVLTPNYAKRNQVLYVIISLAFSFGIYYLFYIWIYYLFTNRNIIYALGGNIND